MVVVRTSTKPNAGEILSRLSIRIRKNKSGIWSNSAIRLAMDWPLTGEHNYHLPRYRVFTNAQYSFHAGTEDWKAVRL